MFGVEYSISSSYRPTKVDDRRTIKSRSADFVGEIRTSSIAKFITETSGDKIGRVTYKSRPIFSFVCHRLKTRSSVNTEIARDA